MFKIQWRNRQRSFTVQEGLSSYPSYADAAAQVERWKRVFPANSYYIVGRWNSRPPT